MPNSQRSGLLTIKLTILGCGISALAMYLGFIGSEGQGRIGYAIIGSIAVLVGLIASAYLIRMLRK